MPLYSAPSLHRPHEPNLSWASWRDSRSFVSLSTHLVAMRLSLLILCITTASCFSPAPSGRATLTHYDLPYKYVASCGCVGLSTRHPTAALNSMAFGSNNSYGPLCGVCYRLTLESTPLTPPPPDGTGMTFAANDTEAPSIVVKITDSCPLGGEWCTQTPQRPSNSLGSRLHFDLAWPSRAISHDFFPTDQGRDYGVWWAQYDVVDCVEWSGYNDQEAVGSDWAQQGSACCPLRPSHSQDISTLTTLPANEQHCPSYSDQIAQGLTSDEMYAQVPNTSNVLSKNIIDSQANNAWTILHPDMLFWSWRGTRRYKGEKNPPTTLVDWQAIGIPPLLRQR